MEIDPLPPIPRRELLVWENDAVRESLLRGVEDFAAGRIEYQDDLIDKMLSED